MRGEIGDKERLGHILDCIREIADATNGVTKEAFEENHVLRIAVVKWVEIIGEAANNITEITKGKTTDIPWKKIIGFRHYAVHEYFGIDFMIVWKLLTDDLPDLEKAVLKLLNEFE